MDPALIFRQGLASVPSRPAQPYSRNPPRSNVDVSDDDGSGHYIAHTLTACCRCRQRKTRCDPSLPRCLPCERSGSTCEYLDTTKGKKINRYYVIALQDKIRDLEAELFKYTVDRMGQPKTKEDVFRPGGIFRFKASDNKPKFLGPSSGIAMTRLLMEEAKRYTASNRIFDLVPGARADSQNRMPSIQMTGPLSGRKKSYPMLSERPAEGLPSRATMDKLIELFIQRSQVFWPVLHEKDFEKDMEAVYNGDKDPYKNFVLRMVVAIALHQCDTQYVGLADSYYMAAMQHVEAVLRLKGIKTLQCLVLMGDYSLLTPIRTAANYVIGLATRMCQQQLLADQQSTNADHQMDARTIDMRRRLIWIVAAMDFGLSYQMGRPSGLATRNDDLGVPIFSNVNDEHITADGIITGPADPRKLFAIHSYKFRELQAEVRDTLYEQQRSEPIDDSHEWYGAIEKKMKAWLDSAPSNPQWSPTWCACMYHHTRVVQYRPSPQVPQPSPRAAAICFESSTLVISLTEKLISNGFFGITWLLLLMLTSCLNALLWSISFAEVRQAHARQEVEDAVARALACLERCAERWPGIGYTAQLYTVMSNACLQSYDSSSDNQQPTFSFASPSSATEPQSSPESHAQTGTTSSPQLPYLNRPQFGHVFDSSPESTNTYTFDPDYPPPQPTFRSNSIFCNPATDRNRRRFSYFPPEGAAEDPAQAAASQDPTTSSANQQGQIPIPVDSISTGAVPAATTGATVSPQNIPLQTLALSDASSAPRVVPTHEHMLPPQGGQPTQVTSNYTTPRLSVPQRPLPSVSSAADWFSPPAPFMTPYNFGSMSSNVLSDVMSNNFPETPLSNLGGLQNMIGGFDGPGRYGFLQGRQGSLTHSQQMELMNALETEGVGDIEAFLNAGNNMTDVGWY